MSNEELLELRHRRDYKIHPGSLAAPSGKIELWI
jgi:hypothetical protein